MGRDPAITDLSAPVMGFLSHVRASVSQLRLYPKESPQVLKVCTIAYQTFLAALDERDSMTLCRTTNGLLINGERLPGTATGAAVLESHTAKLLEDSRIKSITLHRGLTIEELVTFLHALTHKFWDVKEGKEINQRLRDARVLSVSVDEVEYVALGQGDIVIQDATRKLEAAKSRVADVLKSIEAVVEGSAEEGTVAEVRLQVVKMLLDRDPTLLERAHGEAGTPADGGETRGEAGSIALDDARRALGDIAGLLQGASDETKGRLRSVADAILGAFRGSPTVYETLRGFLRDGAVELLPGWLKQVDDERPKEPAAVMRARAVNEMDADARIDALTREGVPLLKELGALNREQMVTDTLRPLAGFLSDRSPARRCAVCDALQQVRPVLESESGEAARCEVERSVLAAMEVEDDSSVYPKLAGVAVALVDGHIRRGDLLGAMVVLDPLHRHAQVKEAGHVNRAEHAFLALERVALGAGFGAVEERLADGDPEAQRVVEYLDAAATRFLVGRIKASEGLAERTRYAESIARAGPSAAAILIDVTEKTSVPSDALRLMEVLPNAASENLVEVALDRLLRHPAIAVRRRAALMLAERATPRAGSLVLGALSEEADPAVRATLVEALGALRYRDAVETLCLVADARQEADEVRSEACSALGRIADRSSVPLLVRLSQGGSLGLVRLLRPIVREVRVAATRALGSFPNDPIARETLRKALQDTLPGVRAAAEEAQRSPLLRAADGKGEVVTPGSSRTRIWKLAGSLTEIPLDQVCQVLSSAEKGGLLTLQFEGQKARVWFDGGFVVAAEFCGKRDQDAFNALFTRIGGHFSFQPGVAAPETRFRAPIAQLLLEAHRLADEASHPAS